MMLFNIFLNLKFKYVISFICVITFYLFAFEKRYFQINSDWKVLCHEKSISLCEFKLKLTDYKSLISQNLAIYSKFENELQIIDVYNSSMRNNDILSSPKIILTQNLNNFVQFDIKKKSNGQIVIFGIDALGLCSCYIDLELKYTKSIIDNDFFPTATHFSYDTIEYVAKEEIIFLSGSYQTTDSEEYIPFVLTINASNIDVIWHKTLKIESSDRSLTNTNKTDQLFTSEIFNHWKLSLMQHHKNRNHLPQKTNHINLKNNFPIYYGGKNSIMLSKSQKKLKEFHDKHVPTDRIIGNFNSLIVIHKYGLTLLDIYSGVVLASEAINFDTHSAYALWPSADHQQEENLFQIKFISKLDHYSNDRIDINHKEDISHSESESHQSKIHCNLIFHKLNPVGSLTPEISNWFAGHLCDPVSFMDYPRFSDKTWLEDSEKSVAPLVTNNYATPSGVWGRLYHLIGRKLLDKNSKNAICLSSDGLMTSLSSHGHQNWRTNAQVGWLHISRMVKMTGNSYVDSGTKQVYEKFFLPSLTEIRLSYLNQSIRAVLSLGFESMSMVDLSDGYLLASHSLPCTPVGKPIVISVPYRGILSMSGDQIIVVKCENMVIGFSLTHYVPWMYFLTLSSLMVVAILFLMWSLDPRNSYFGELWI